MWPRSLVRRATHARWATYSKRGCVRVACPGGASSAHPARAAYRSVRGAIRNVHDSRARASCFARQAPSIRRCGGRVPSPSMREQGLSASSLLSRAFKWRYLPEIGATRPAAVSDGENMGETNRRARRARRQPRGGCIRSVASTEVFYVYRLIIDQTRYHRVPPDHPTSQSHRAHRSVFRYVHQPQLPCSTVLLWCTRSADLLRYCPRASAEWTGVVPAHNSLILMSCCD